MFGSGPRMTVAAVFRSVSDMESDPSDAAFNTMTARLIRREALRRAAEELNTTSGPGLEDVLSRISAEVTAEAIEKHAGEKHASETDETTLDPKPTPR